VSTADADFEAFVSSIENLSFLTASARLQQEALRVDRAMEGSGLNRRGAPAARAQYGIYRARLGGLGFWMINGILPGGEYVEADHQMLKRLAESWVRRGDLLPKALEVFQTRA
jgi:hypothetical protein